MANVRRPDQIIISITAMVLMYGPIVVASLGVSTKNDVMSALLTPEVIILVGFILAFLIFPRRTRHVFETYRWPSFDLVLGSLGFAVVVLFLLNEMQQIDFNSVLLVCEFGCATLGFGNGINTYYDYRYAVDSEQWVGDDERLVTGQTTIRQVIFDTLIALVISLVVLFRMSQIHEHALTSLLAICVCCLFIAYAYTAPPFKFKYHCLGEVCIIFYAILLMLLMSLMLNDGHYSLQFLCFAFFIGFLRSLPNYLFNVRDFSGDKKAGILTLPIWFGEQGIKISFIIIVIILAVSAFIFAWISGPWLLLCHITLPFGLYAAIKRSYLLPVNKLYQQGLMMEYTQYYFLTLMIACYLQVAANFFTI